MARTQYFVVKHDGQWKVKLDGQHYGPFDTQAAAIRSAVTAANDTGAKGIDAQVLVQGQDNLSGQNGLMVTIRTRHADKILGSACERRPRFLLVAAADI